MFQGTDPTLRTLASGEADPASGSRDGLDSHEDGHVCWSGMAQGWPRPHMEHESREDGIGVGSSWKAPPCFLPVSRKDPSCLVCPAMWKHTGARALQQQGRMMERESRSQAPGFRFLPDDSFCTFKPIGGGFSLVAGNILSHTETLQVKAPQSH